MTQKPIPPKQEAKFPLPEKTDIEKIPDSGQRRSFGTGAVRDSDSSKPKIALISPYALMRLGKRYAGGAVKYAPRNWELGIPLSEYINSLGRHLLALMMGDASEDHAAAIMWNIAAYIHVEELIGRGKMPAALDDMPHYETRSQEELHSWLLALKKEFDDAKSE
jgi:hypothetical protein